MVAAVAVVVNGQSVMILVVESVEVVTGVAVAVG